MPRLIGRSGSLFDNPAQSLYNDDLPELPFASGVDIRVLRDGMPRTVSGQE